MRVKQQMSEQTDEQITQTPPPIDKKNELHIQSSKNLRLFISTSHSFEPVLFITGYETGSITISDVQIPIIKYKLAPLKFFSLPKVASIKSIVTFMKFLAQRFHTTLDNVSLMACVNDSTFQLEIRRDRVYQTRHIDLVMEDFNTGQTLLSPLDWASATQQKMRDLKLENSLLSITNQKVTTLNQDFAITINGLQQALESLKEENTTINQTLVQKAEENRILNRKNIELSLKVKSLNDFVSTLERNYEEQKQRVASFYRATSEVTGNIKEVALQIFSLGNTVKQGIVEGTIDEYSEVIKSKVMGLENQIRSMEEKFNTVDNLVSKQNSTPIVKQLSAPTKPQKPTLNIDDINLSVEE